MGYKTHSQKEKGNLSPTLFKLYIEENFKKVRKENIGVKLNETLVQMLYFADDIVVIAESEGDLAHKHKKMNDILREHYMKINH